MAHPSNVEAARLADLLERSLRGGAWHGPAVIESIEGLDATTAAARPIDAGHSAGELVGHVAYWLEACRRRLVGEPERTDGDWQWNGDWAAAVAELERAHRELHAAVLALDDARLDDAVPGSDPTVRGMLLGLLQHNAYHAGQLALLRKATEPRA